MVLTHTYYRVSLFHIKKAPAKNVYIGGKNYHFLLALELFAFRVRSLMSCGQKCLTLFAHFLFLGLRIAPFLLSWLILRVGKKSQCSSSLWSWQLLLSICESLLGGSSKSHISVLITVHKWNFYKCFSKVTFWGEILFWKQILDYLEFFGFTLCFRIFQAKNFFFKFFSHQIT